MVADMNFEQLLGIIGLCHFLTESIEQLLHDEDESDKENVPDQQPLH